MTDELAGKLSPRQEELCVLIAGRGMSRKRAALAMGISVHTVDDYIHRISVRLGMGPTQAVHAYYWNVLNEDGEGAA